MDRLPAPLVEKLMSVLGGDPIVEDSILIFINHKYNARNLFFIPENVAREILKRPAAFKRAALEHARIDIPF